MQLIKPAVGQDERQFWSAVTATGSTVTFLRGGIYSVPDTVILDLVEKHIKFISVIPQAPTEIEKLEQG